MLAVLIPSDAASRWNVYADARKAITRRMGFAIAHSKNVFSDARPALRERRKPL
jgi:hypothetical protein